MSSVTKIKVLDTSGPPGLPSLLLGSTELEVTTLISALSFSPDGEGLVAFSEHSLTIRWWSLGSAWWQKLSRNLAPVQCTKLIFVPPYEGFCPSTSRNSIITSVMGHENEENFQRIKDELQRRSTESSCYSNRKGNNVLKFVKPSGMKSYMYH